MEGRGVGEFDGRMGWVGSGKGEGEFERGKVPSLHQTPLPSTHYQH